MNELIFEAIKEDCRIDPFFEWTGDERNSTVDAAKFSFRKRPNEAYFITAKFVFPSTTDRMAFQKYLVKKCSAHGWVPRVTSGGYGKWTYRLNGGLP